MTKTTYQWKQAARSVRGLDPELFGREIAKLAKTRSATAEALVDAARPPLSPLHSAFTWDDGVAAGKWRLEEARHVIQALVITEIIDGEEAEIRAFVSVTPEDSENKVYHPIRAALSDDNYYQQVLENGFRDAAAFADKYRQISELGKIVRAIDTAIKEHVKAQAA